MNRVVVEGYQGGKVMVNEHAHVFAYFSRRYEMGASCQVALGPVLDTLLALKPGEHLQHRIEGIEDICVCASPESLPGDHPDAAVYILSCYWDMIDMIVVSQDKLRQAGRWASFASQREAAVAR